jgi:hypothetical protein
MTAEREDPSQDPFLSWVQAAIAAHGPGDPVAHDQLAELRELASEIENEITPLASSNPKEVSPGWFIQGVEAMDPRWLERWLTFDPDQGTGVRQQHPRRPDGHNAALIDNTTINLVAGYVEHQEPPSALGILDLANFVNNLILRDALVALDHPLGTRGRYRRIGEEIRSPGEAIIPGDLRPSEKAILGAALLWIRQLARADTDTAIERTEATRTWSTILGNAAPSSKKMFDVRFEDALYYLNAIEYSDSPVGQPPDNNTPSLINGLFTRAPHRRRGEQVAAVQAANCRALLNLEAGRRYNIPYAGGITRVPIKRLLWQRGRQGDATLAAIEKSDLGTVRILDDAYQRRVAAALVANQQTIVLPVFLAAVLSRIDHLNQFYECADELREQAKPLRRRLVAIEQALDSTQPQHEIRKLLAAFGEDTRMLRRTLWDLAPAASAVTGVVLTAATAQPLLMTATLAALAAGPSMRPQTWDRLANRVWRRDLWFVTELGQVSSELVNATPRLEELWGRHFHPGRFGARLDSLRALGTL